MACRKEGKKIPIIVILILQAFSFNSWADSIDRVDTLYDDCVKKAGAMNNSVVATCSDLQSKAIKKEMNKLYNIIYKKILEQSDADAMAFENSQKYWLKYRNNHCLLMGSYVGSPMYNYCPMQLNELRVTELKELAQ